MQCNYLDLGLTFTIYRTTIKVSIDTKENAVETSSIESELEVNTYLANLRYALDRGAVIKVQIERRVDEGRDEKYTNAFTLTSLFQKEDLEMVIKRELKSLEKEDYIRTVKDIRFPKRSEMREFGKLYNGTEEIYIKIRVELLGEQVFGEHMVFVMSFHYSTVPFSDITFPYKKQGGCHEIFEKRI